MRARLTVKDCFVLLGFVVLCLPVFLTLMPNIEQGRREARLTYAYNRVRELRATYSEILKRGTDEIAGMHTDADGQPTSVELPDRDPWDQPYQLVRLNTNGSPDVRVVSGGPNRSSPAVGFDDDDIYSDMPISPTQTIVSRKRRQFQIALLASGLVWLTLSLLYFKIVR